MCNLKKKIIKMTRQLLFYLLILFSDSEWIDEYINFSMMCLFLSVYTISNRNNIPIFNFSIFSVGKINQISALRRSKFPLVFKRAGKNKKNIKKKRELIFNKIDFWPCSFNWIFILSFSAHCNIFKIFLLVLNCLWSFSAYKLFLFFFYKFQ